MNKQEIIDYINGLNVADMKKKYILYYGFKSYDKALTKLKKKKYPIKESEFPYLIITSDWNLHTGGSACVFTENRIYHGSTWTSVDDTLYSDIKCFKLSRARISTKLDMYLYDGTKIELWQYPDYLYDDTVLNKLISIINFCSGRRFSKLINNESSERKEIDTSQPYLFLSYRHEDYYPLHIESIINMLYEKGIQVWFDENIPAGTDWDEEITSKLEGCKLFLPVIGKKYNGSEFCRKEMKIALERKKDMIPTVVSSDAVITSSVHTSNIIIQNDLIEYFNTIQQKDKSKYSENEFYDHIARAVAEIVPPTEDFLRKQQETAISDKKRKRGKVRAYILGTIVSLMIGIFFIWAMSLMFRSLIDNASFFSDLFSGDSSSYSASETTDEPDSYEWTKYFHWDNNDFFYIINGAELYGKSKIELEELLGEELGELTPDKYDSTLSYTYHRFPDETYVEFIFRNESLIAISYINADINTPDDIISSAEKNYGSAMSTDDKCYIWDQGVSSYSVSFSRDPITQQYIEINEYQRLIS